MNDQLKKWIIFLVTLAILAVSYQLTAIYTLSRSMNTSLATPIDRLIPFLPGTVIFYLTIYFFWLPAVMSKNISMREFARIVAAVSIAFATTLLLNMVIPSAYPRPEISASDSSGRWLVKNFLYDIDLPNNTFPSSHVVVATTLILMMAPKMGKWAFRAYSSWGALITLSTLTVKQHYFFDVLAAMTISVLAVLLVKKFWPQQI